MSAEVTGNELLNAATEWYRNNGALSIPQEGLLDGSAIDAQTFRTLDDYTLMSGNSDIIFGVPGYVYPVLAAISLGFDTPTLAKIIIDQVMNFTDILNMQFQDDWKTPISLHSQGGIPLSPLKIHIEVFKSYSSHPDLRRSLYKNASASPRSKESIALMHTSEQSLWPSTQIEAHAKEIMTPSEGVVESQFVEFGFTPSKATLVQDLPNSSPLDLFRRAGMLSEPVLRKQTGQFEQWENLILSACQGAQQQIEMLKACTRVSHKPTVDLIVRGLLSMTADATEDELEGEKIYPFLQSIFEGNIAFKPVLDSLVLRMNLLPLHRYPDELDELHAYPSIYGDLTNNPQTLLSRVARELLSRPADHLGHQDYSIFKKLKLMGLPPQVIDFSPEHLVNHVLNSMGTFVTKNEVTCEHKLSIDEHARASILDMGSLLLRHHEFDYSQFADRDESDKVLLIKGGFDIKKFKGLSYKARGQVLEDGMGL